MFHRIGGRALLVVSLFAAVAGLGCSPLSLYPVVRITPTVVLDEPGGAIAGHPVTLRFSWTTDPLFVTPRVPHRVFVHFLDENGQLAFTDDHSLPTDVRGLRPGAHVEYARRVILPDRAQRLSVRVGLFSASFPYKATVLNERTRDPDFPTVASIEARENESLAEEEVAGAEGFDPWEIDGRATSRSSRWAGRRGRFLFLHRAEGTTLLIQGFTMRSRLARDPSVTLRTAVAQTTQILASDDRVVLQLDVPGDGRARLMAGSLESDLSFNDRGREVAFCVERFRAIPLTRPRPR